MAAEEEEKGSVVPRETIQSESYLYLYLLHTQQPHTTNDHKRHHSLASPDDEAAQQLTAHHCLAESPISLSHAHFPRRCVLVRALTWMLLPVLMQTLPSKPKTMPSTNCMDAGSAVGAGVTLGAEEGISIIAPRKATRASLRCGDA